MIAKNYPTTPFTAERVATLSGHDPKFVESVLLLLMRDGRIEQHPDDGRYYRLSQTRSGGSEPAPSAAPVGGD